MTTTTVNEEGFIGEGIVFMGGNYANPTAPLLDIGQVSDLKLAISEDTQDLKNYRGGGGLAAQASIITKVEATIQLDNLDPANLAKAMYGASAPNPTQVVTTDAQTAYPNALLKTKGIGLSAVTVTATGPVWAAAKAYALGDVVIGSTHIQKCTAAGTSGTPSAPTWKIDGTTTTDGTATWTDMGPVTLVNGVDYLIISAGIWIQPASIMVPSTGLAVNLAYTTTTSQVVQTMLNNQVQQKLVFSGLNRAQGGKPVVVTLLNCKIKAAKDVSFIGDKFAQLQLIGTLIKDPTVVGQGLSQFATIEEV